jgi:uncharacterized membrane protein YuzA (DUF378 family)
VSDHILARAKAYAALVGAVVTALLGTLPPHTQLWTVLTGVAAVATAVATYKIPNAATNTDPPVGPGE